MDWYETSITAKEVKAIPHIVSLNQSDELANDMQDFCQTKEIALTPGGKSFVELFSCKEPEHNPILIVAVATTHPYEESVYGMPYYPQFTVLMLLFQEGPHFVLPCSKTHVNLHLGNMIRDMDYGASKTFDKYMMINVNHKLVPIQRQRPGSGKVQRQLNFDSYYITTSLVARPN